MKFLSTRGGGAPVGFREALFRGLAEDGGLVCLAAADDPGPYAQLLGLVGLGVKIFGMLADGTDMPLVQVTVSLIQ